MTDDCTISGQSRTRRPFVLEGWHVALMFISFFLVVGSVNGIMLHAATSTMPGLDARNGYDVSQRYNGMIGAAQGQTSRGWQADISHVRSMHDTRFTIQLNDAGGRPLQDRAVSLRLSHPALRAADRVVDIQETTPGRYTGVVEGLAAGGWTLSLEVRDEPRGEIMFASRNRMVLTP
jgi:nitrogen fixation protein FixH